jgi:[ribosomal protein S18]-alanine N-acetyltransferase
VLFTIRGYRPEDFATLWEIDQLCFPPGIAYRRHELVSYIRRRNAFTLIAEASRPGAAQQEILGFLVAEAGQRRAGHIITIDVLSAARKQGLGSSLLETTETRMRSSGCQVICLETAVDNAAAIAFYKRHGYDIIETVPRYYSNGVDALVLEKDLLRVSPSDNLLR